MKRNVYWKIPWSMKSPLTVHLGAESPYVEFEFVLSSSLGPLGFTSLRRSLFFPPGKYWQLSGPGGGWGPLKKVETSQNINKRGFVLTWMSGFGQALQYKCTETRQQFRCTTAVLQLGQAKCVCCKYRWKHPIFLNYAWIQKCHKRGTLFLKADIWST